jgi:hypothetical protein
LSKYRDIGGEFRCKGRFRGDPVESIVGTGDGGFNGFPITGGGGSYRYREVGPVEGCVSSRTLESLHLDQICGYPRGLVSQGKTNGGTEQG